MTTDTQQLNETDIGKDANFLIMELNKGLQSVNLGEQCKAIAQFPNLLEKYPFPIVVNSIFLKITQIFCDGTNYLRLCVLRACRTCQAHLEKLTVCDDIVRKLRPFTESNDPVTRALTLRLFGTLCQITREHIGVHHAILKQIESHYMVEADAAIWSSHQLAPISSAFAVSLCPILCKLLGSLSTELEVKMKLLRLGKHMHHDVQIVERMRSCLVEMLTVYGTIEFVTSILDTLTILESAAPLHTSEQLDLLLGYLSDERSIVRQKALRDLGTLARNVPHYWERKHVTRLCLHYMSSTQAPVEQEEVFRVFYYLACSSQAVDLFESGLEDSDPKVTDCVRDALLTFQATRVTLKAMQLACKLTLLQNACDLPSECVLPPGQLICLLFAQFLSKSSSCPDNAESPSENEPWFLTSTDISPEELRNTYSLLVQFFSAFPEYAPNLYKLRLTDFVQLDGGPRGGILCEFLSTLKTRLPSLFCDQAPTFLAQLCSRVSENNNSTSDIGSILSASGLLFQLSERSMLSAKDQESFLLAVAHCVSRPAASPSQLPTWLAYQLARQANRFGQHDLAARIYTNLVPLTLTERTNYWLVGLSEFSRAEAQLVTLSRRIAEENEIVHVLDSKFQRWVDDLIEGLRNSADSMLKARTSLLCVGGPDNRWFQAEYVGIRSSLCLSLAELCISANFFTHVGVRPFASEETNGNSSSQPTPKPLHGTPVWVKRQLSMWCDLDGRLASLRAQCLDADQTTHTHLIAINQLVDFFIRLLESIDSVYKSDNCQLLLPCVDLPTQSPRADPFITVLPDLHKIAQLYSKSTPNPPSEFAWIPLLVLRVAQVASHWPRFFFQRLQTTNVRLVLLPKAGSGPDDVLTINNEVGHMVQVMGVVQQRSRLPNNQVACRVTAVQVELTVMEATTEGHHRSTRQHCSGSRPELVFFAQRSARLQRDYFHCEFCVRFHGHAQPKTGTLQQQRPPDKLYSIRATPILLDASGSRWRLTRASGAPKETALVRVETLHSNQTSILSSSTIQMDQSDTNTPISAS
ncbi:hypothetical protein CRM22_001305 [Opisthorchis felineus]|uniref:Integrator complex subunit 7 n=1 Tax=Opisthorchis felineus TaxID=147828 RepID=A0A4S2MBD3_OPIFE|nr:hypothetical protein CRM22_001305 [Opisthorchis felineus]